MCSQAVRGEQAVRYVHVHVHMRMHMRNAQWKPGACHGTRHMVQGVRVARGARWLAVGRRRRAGGTRAVARGGAEQRGQAACPLGPMERRGARHGTAGKGAASGGVGAWGDAWVVRMSGIWAHSSGSLAFFISSRVTFISAASHGEHVRGR